MPIQHLEGDTDFRCDVLKLTVERDGATTDTSTYPQILKDAIPCRPDVPKFYACPEFL